MLGDPVLAAQVRDLLTEPTRSGDREDPEREDEPRGQPGRRRPEARHRAQVSRQAADECLVDRWNARRINRPETRALGSGATDLSPIAPLPSIRLYRSSLSSPAEAGTAGLTGTSTPDSTHALWLGAKRGASNPSLISRVTAKRLSHLGGRKRRELSGNPSDAVSTSPSAAEMTPSLLVSTRATSTAYASNRRWPKLVTPGSNEVR